MQAQLDDYGARRLVAAMLYRAVRDAQMGDVIARDWLLVHGVEWAGDLDIVPERVRHYVASANQASGVSRQLQEWHKAD